MKRTVIIGIALLLTITLGGYSDTNQNKLKISQEEAEEEKEKNIRCTLPIEFLDNSNGSSDKLLKEVITLFNNKETIEIGDIDLEKKVIFVFIPEGQYEEVIEDIEKEINNDFDTIVEGFDYVKKITFSEELDEVVIVVNKEELKESIDFPDTYIYNRLKIYQSLKLMSKDIKLSYIDLKTGDLIKSTNGPEITKN